MAARAPFRMLHTLEANNDTCYKEVRRSQRRNCGGMARKSLSRRVLEYIGSAVSQVPVENAEAARSNA